VAFDPRAQLLPAYAAPLPCLDFRDATPDLRGEPRIVVHQLLRSGAQAGEELQREFRPLPF
jgi:hypothetical protein